MFDEELVRKLMDIGLPNKISEKVEGSYYAVGAGKASADPDTYQVVLVSSQTPELNIVVGTTENEIEAVETARKLAATLDIDFKGLMEGINPEDEESEEKKIEKLLESRFSLTLNQLDTDDVIEIGRVVEELNTRFKNPEQFEQQIDTIALDVAEKLGLIYTREGDELVFSSKNAAHVIPNESKLTEQDEEPEDTPPSSEPEEIEEPEASKEPEIKKSTPEEEQVPEITKEYIGNTEDDHYYLISTEDDDGNVEDLQIVDQEGVEKFSAKVNALDPNNIPEFLFKGIKELRIESIEFGIFEQYLFPYVFEQEEEPEDEEAPEDLEQMEEPEEPVENKNESKVNEGIVTEEDIVNWFLSVVKGIEDSYEEGASYREPEVDAESLRVLLRQFKNPTSESKVDEAEVNSPWQEKKDEIQNMVQHAPPAGIERIWDALDKAGFVGAPKVTDESKTHLIEMKITDHENNQFDVYLVDDGTIDTVIDVNGKEFRFDSEFASFWRDEDGTLSEEGLKELALDALSNMEEEDYNELVARGSEAEIASTPEEKTVPAARPGLENEGKDDPGVRDGTGPAKGSIQRKEKGDIGKRKEKGEKCPNESKTDEARMGVDYVKGVKKELKIATDALKDKDYDAAAKALEDVADDAADAAKAAKKMKREADAKAEDEKNKEVKETEETIDEKEAPVCPKCNKRHWPFQKCGEVEKKSSESKTKRGERDGTGPHKDSAQRSVSKTGRRKAAGEKCPSETEKPKELKPKDNKADTGKLQKLKDGNETKVKEDTETKLTKTLLNLLGTSDIKDSSVVLDNEEDLLG